MLVEENQLWQAVILQAVLDCGAKMRYEKEKEEQIKTARWFNVKNKDFVEVCSMAGWPPEWVIKNMKTGSFIKTATWRGIRRGKYGSK